MGANAQTSVPAFTAGQVLTAQQQTEINTGIPVFATTTTRDAAFGGTGEKTLAEGQFAYIEASNTTQYYDGSSWLTLGGKILQIVTATKTNTFTTSSTTFVDVTDLSATITPSSTSNKILVLGIISCSDDYGVQAGTARLARGSTAIFVGDAAGSRTPGFCPAPSFAGAFVQIGVSYLDSPASTSALTYKWQVAMAGAGTFYVNRSKNDTDNAAHNRAASSITVCEVLG